MDALHSTLAKRVQKCLPTSHSNKMALFGIFKVIKVNFFHFGKWEEAWLFQKLIKIILFSSYYGVWYEHTYMWTSDHLRTLLYTALWRKQDVLVLGGRGGTEPGKNCLVLWIQRPWFNRWHSSLWVGGEWMQSVLFGVHYFAWSKLFGSLCFWHCQTTAETNHRLAIFWW